ncbi:MAG: C_GCAxxG_C_C family protein [Ruminococcaceae bacterium]|nr:C_GCAxxG_C_C family protein [Oscillospiraceae bacterium]
MNEALRDRVRELFEQKYHCSHAMLMLSMEMRDIENPFLLRCLGGLGGGIQCGKDCGTLTGAACLISSFSPQLGGDETGTGDVYKEPIQELVAWFENEFGSTVCHEICEPVREKRLEYCPGVVASTFTKCMQILEARGVDVYQE